MEQRIEVDSGDRAIKVIGQLMKWLAMRSEKHDDTLWSSSHKGYGYTVLIKKIDEDTPPDTFIQVAQ